MSGFMLSIFSKNTRSQVLIAVLMIVLVFISILLTKTLFNRAESRSGSEAQYRNVTMTDAYLKCVDRVSNEYGDELYSYAMDDLSTRYDQQHRRFLVFMNIEVLSGPKNAAESSFVSCQVSVMGAISKFDISVESDVDGGRSRRSKGNPFGFEFN
ncbi:hypothetical protein [Sessilibacter corallicola]